MRTGWRAARGSVVWVVLAAAVLMPGCRVSEAPLPPAVARDAPEVLPSTPGPSPSRAPAPTARGGWRDTIPSDLALAAGMPEDGGDFRRARTGVSLALCGRAVPRGDLVDRGRVSVTGPEYGQARDLRLFDDARAARRFVQAVRAVVLACPRDQVHGTGTTQRVRSSPLAADEAFTLTQTYESPDRWPVLGALIVQVARVGNAVLVTSLSGEYDPQRLRPGLRDNAEELADLVDALCVFAADPC